MILGSSIWCSLYECWADDVDSIIDTETLEESDECCGGCGECFFAEELED